METMSPAKEQVTPLAAAAALSYRTSSSDEEDPKKWQVTSPRFCKRRGPRYCCYCLGLGLAIAIVFVVVAVTIYKVREPEMTMNTIAIRRMNVAPPNVTLSILADVSVKNRNPTTFYFDRSLTSLYYHDALMGSAYSPPGRSAGRRTYRTNVTLEVVSDQLLSNPDLVNDVASGLLEMNSSTAVGGHVMVFGVFRHHVDVLMNCTVLVAVANQSILHQVCRQHVWI